MKLHSGLYMQPLNYFSVWNCRSPKMSAMQTNVVVCRAFYHARFGTLGSITNEIFLLWEPSGEIWWFPFSVSLFLPSSLHLVHSSSLFSLSLFILILFLFCPCCFSQCTYFTVCLLFLPLLSQQVCFFSLQTAFTHQLLRDESHCIPIALLSLELSITQLLTF